MDNSIREIAKFLDIPIVEEKFDELVESLTFSGMKRDADSLLPHFATVFNGGASSFINKGTNGRWKSLFSKESLAIYDKMIHEKYPVELIQWCVHGKKGYDINSLKSL